MYASVVQCDMQAVDSTLERRQLWRILASRLGALPGFVAFVALDSDAVTGRAAALCIFEDPDGAATADRAVELWHKEYPTTIGTGIQRIGAGAVIVQKGL